VHEPPANANAEETDEDKELKFWALATLGNLAASNDANRTAINKLDIIPLLVRMTTTAVKVTRDSSTGASGEKGAGKDLQLVAGEVLSSMLAKGDKSIEMAIVSGIVDTVRGEGSKPPESFPELMRSLQTAARERLAKVQAGSDEEALNLALDFGRWIKLPTVLLGTARNGFKARQIKALKEAQHLERRRGLGLAGEASPTGSPETSTGTSTGISTGTMQLAVDTHSAGAASEHEQQTLSHADKGRQGQKAGRQRRVPSLRAPAPTDDGDVMVNPARNYHRPWTRGSAVMVPKAKPPDLVLAGAGIVPKPKPPRAGAALAAAPAPKPKGFRGPSSESETSQRETSQRPTRASGDSGDSGDSGSIGSSPPHKGDASQRSTQRSTQRSGDASQRSFRARDPFAGDALQDSALLAHPLALNSRQRFSSWQHNLCVRRQDCTCALATLCRNRGLPAMRRLFMCARRRGISSSATRPTHLKQTAHEPRVGTQAWATITRLTQLSPTTTALQLMLDNDGTGASASRFTLCPASGWTFTSRRSTWSAAIRSPRCRRSCRFSNSL
jgi:hypothetical protein